MKHTALIPMILLVFAFSATAQTTQDDPVGCATEKSKSMNFLVGEWKVTSKFRTSSRENKWESTEGTSVIKHRFKDCVYDELLNGERNGRPHQLLGLFSYNNISDKLQWVGGHSEHGVLSLYEGEFEEGDLVLKSQLMLGSNLIYFRIVISKTEDGFDVKSERSRDGKLWDMGWFRRYKRA